MALLETLPDEDADRTSAGDAAPGGPPSRSYVVPCSTAFRDAVTQLAARRQASVADLARGVLLLVAPAAMAMVKDPGGPGREDREVVVVRSGAAKDRRLLRKPRLQLRLPPDLPIETIRRALALALTLDAGQRRLDVVDPASESHLAARYKRAEEDVARLREAVELLRFEPLGEGIKTRGDALFVLGFPPYSRPSMDAVRERFRQLAKVLHPDSPIGDNVRMAQLNEAMKVLRSGGL